MKIAVVVDEENYITPLEYGNSIMLIDEETKKITEYENPGYGAMHGGKERCMAGLLSLNPDAIIVKEGVLCPGSYFMSKGKMKYIAAEQEKLDEVMRALPELAQKAVPELEPMMYRE